MERLRVILLASLAGVLVWLGNAWIKDTYSVQPSTTTPLKVETPSLKSEPTETRQPIPMERRIRFQTDVLTGIIDKQGGKLVYLALRAYPEQSSTSAQPFVLLDHTEARYYVAQTDWLETNPPLATHASPLYESEYDAYTLTSDQQSLCIKLKRMHQGLEIQKQFILKPNSYQIDIQHQAHNTTQTNYSIQPYAELTQQVERPKTGWFSTQAYTGSVISCETQRYQKIDFNQLHPKSLPKGEHNGWLAFVEPYFTSAWIPKLTPISYYTHHQGKQKTLGMVGKTLNLAPSQTVTTNLSLYTGPKSIELLKISDPHLPLLVDYGTFWFIAKPFVWLLKQLHRWLGNWKWATICTLIFIRLALLPISAKAFNATRAQNQLKPKIDELSKRYGNDWQRFAQARAALYQQAGISMSNGLLAMLVALMNIFIFFAWLGVLRETIELRQVPFMPWIPSLFSNDTYYIFPVLLGLASYANLFMDRQTMPTPSEQDITGNYIALLPSVFFVLFSSNWPIGSILYYLLEQTISAIQKWWLLRKPLTSTWHQASTL